MTAGQPATSDGPGTTDLTAIDADEQRRIMHEIEVRSMRERRLADAGKQQKGNGRPVTGKRSLGGAPGGSANKKGTSKQMNIMSMLQKQ